MILQKRSMPKPIAHTVSNRRKAMTSGWTGERYAGIPAGTVSDVNTMEPRQALLGAYPPADTPGLSYYLTRGQTPLFGGLTGDPLYTRPSLVPEGCAQGNGCGVPPMAYCRTFECPRGSAPFPGAGCVAPPRDQ